MLNVKIIYITFETILIFILFNYFLEVAMNSHYIIQFIFLEFSERYVWSAWTFVCLVWPEVYPRYLPNRYWHFIPLCNLIHLFKKNKLAPARKLFWNAIWVSIKLHFIIQICWKWLIIFNCYSLWEKTQKWKF